MNLRELPARQSVSLILDPAHRLAIPLTYLLLKRHLLFPFFT